MPVIPTAAPEGAGWRGQALAALVVLALAGSGAAQAGRSCEPRKPTPQLIERGLQLAERTAAALDAEHARHGTQVVVLARAGQDLSRHGLRYSHLGWAYRTPQGPWRVVHKLNECGTAVGAVYRQGLGMVSYPWSTKYQQSNQWAIETLAAAMEPATVRTRDQAQAWLRWKGYEPTVLKIGALTRLGGRVTAANVAFDDHPDSERFANRIATVTVDSTLAWLQRAQLASPPVVLPPP
ncbi:DUF2145 domain-containing protein [Acidovorax sp. SUPP3334]|uniref:DUF2145 domain-containing protein n=1 Tax=Acidovorax sp. SUPP3334 TaxID=2920881 RepID=UPI0023DE245A|nr:DUF2145 domain-containing protein [Acidovorax sp. SUPP3334]GKT25427.1 DUF2145 domain-containing protein [Acidovorax sp. SUPP3334]